MKKILVLDACVRREESRTLRLMNQAMETLKTENPEWEFQVLNLCDLHLNYLDTESLKARDELLSKKEYDHDRFRFARQFRDADGIIVAAPFWDLSIPAVLKVYIENVSADGLTFYCDEEGMHGMCKAEWMLYLTTRGGIWQGNPMEQGISYMRSLSEFFGIPKFYEVSADGVDIAELDAEEIMKDALKRTSEICKMNTDKQ